MKHTPSTSSSIKSINSRFHPFQLPSPPATTSSKSIRTSLWPILYTIITVFEAMCVISLEAIAFTGVMLKYVDFEGHNVDIKTYLGLYCFAFLYGLYLMYDTLKHRNSIQLVLLLVYSAALVAYSALQVDQFSSVMTQLDDINSSSIYDSAVTRAILPCLFALPALSGIMFILKLFLGRKLFYEFGWSIYKIVGADKRLRERFFYYQLFIALLKFDLFFFLAFSIQLVTLLSYKDIEFSLTLTVIPVTCVVMFLSAWTVRREKLWLTFIVQALLTCGLAYFFFKIITIYTSKKILYYSEHKTLTTLAAVSIVFLIITLITSIICARNYGHGLKRLYAQKSRSSPPSSLPSTPNSTIDCKDPSYFNFDSTLSNNNYVYSRNLNTNTPFIAKRMEID